MMGDDVMARTAKPASATRRGASRSTAKTTKAPAKRGAAGAGTKKKPARATAASSGVTGLHTLREDYPWEINYGGHEPRKDSPLYTRSRALLTKIAKSTTEGASPVAWYYGDAPWEDHHGGGLWAYGRSGWFFVKNYAGMEWASQFCADPAKVECLRQNALHFYDGFPETESHALALDPHYPFKSILTTPIKTAADIAQWTDSIFNASVPLPKVRHTGVPPKGHGVHHYPTPVWDIEMFKHADFTLWVTDSEGQPAAVLPLHPRGVDKNDPAYKDSYGKVAVAYATPGTKLHALLTGAESRRQKLVADADQNLAKQAFRKQRSPAAKPPR
jgi:hypothetical protein